MGGLELGILDILAGGVLVGFDWFFLGGRVITEKRRSDYWMLRYNTVREDKAYDTRHAHSSFRHAHSGK